jgi:hypothetical protein
MRLSHVPFRRKSTLQRLLDTVGDSLDKATDVKPNLPDVDSGQARKAGLIAAGSLAGLTAGSAAISSLRRRLDGEHQHS